jgi:RNA polymerase subunit RPABC4/transcription elongation factor Spt4
MDGPTATTLRCPRCKTPVEADTKQCPGCGGLFKAGIEAGLTEGPKTCPDCSDLIGQDNQRLVAIWNSLPGVKPVTKFATRKAAMECSWNAIQPGQFARVSSR